MRVPQAETVVVLCDEYNIIHPSLISGLYPTVCVYSRRAVAFNRQFAVRPFGVIESVDAEMQKHSEFSVHLRKLPFIWL